MLSETITTNERKPMSNETANKQADAPNASAIKDYLTRLVSYPLVQFYRIEAKMWRELYQKQKTRNTKMNIKSHTPKSDDQPATERSCPDPDGSISWLRWRRPVTYKWTYGPYSIVYHEAGYWNLRLQKQLLFSHEDLQVVQEWAANYIRSNSAVQSQARHERR